MSTPTAYGSNRSASARHRDAAVPVCGASACSAPASASTLTGTTKRRNSLCPPRPATAASPKAIDASSAATVSSGNPRLFFASAASAASPIDSSRVNTSARSPPSSTKIPVSLNRNAIPPSAPAPTSQRARRSSCQRTSASALPVATKRMYQDGIAAG